VRDLSCGLRIGSTFGRCDFTIGNPARKGIAERFYTRPLWRPAFWGPLSPRPALLPSFFPRKIQQKNLVPGHICWQFLTWPRRQLVTLLRELECSVRKRFGIARQCCHIDGVRPAVGHAVVDFAVAGDGHESPAPLLNY